MKKERAKGVVMDMSVAEHVKDLYKMYIDGARDDELCSRGTEIYDMLEKETSLAGNDSVKQKMVSADRVAFEKVLNRIRGRHNNKPLADYDSYVARKERAKQKKNKKKSSGPFHT